jgi:hypothetical protein
MTKIRNYGTSSSCALRESLNVIRQTHVKLHVLADVTLTDMATTATVLASRIELCDALLVAISGVRNSLAKDLQLTRNSLPVLH